MLGPLSCSRLRATSVLAALLGLGLLPGRVDAQTRKLSGPLAQPSSGDVLDYLVSADGTRVVYRADQAQDGVFELFSAPADGSAPAVRLNAPLPPGGSIGFLTLDPFVPRAFALGASGRVVYTGDQTTDDVFEIYSVPSDGSASPIRLNPNLAAAGDVSSFAISGDGQFVVYMADQLADGYVNLFRVAVDGSAPATNLTPNHDVNGSWFGPRFWLSPDGSAAVFTTSPGSYDERLWGVPTDGSAAPVQLDATPSTFTITYFDHVSISADGSHVVYEEIEDVDDPILVNLYSIPVDASQPPLQLNLQTLNVYQLLVEYDGQDRVVYVETSEDSLYTVKIDGTQRVKLNPPGSTIPFQSFLSSDAANVAFAATTGGSIAIYGAPTDGSQSAVTLVDPAVFNLSVLEVFGSFAVYVAYNGPVVGLYAVPVTGSGDPVLLTSLLSAFFPTEEGERYLAVTPDGQELVFRWIRDIPGVTELYAVPLDGSQPPRKLSAPQVSGGVVQWFRITADGSRVVYAADQNDDDVVELFGARLDGGALVFRYNAPLPLGPVLGDVLGFQAAQDGSRVLYRADQDLDETFELYSVKTERNAAPVKLSGTLTAPGDVLADFALDAQGGSVVYQVQAGTFTLFSAPTDGGQAPLELDSSASEFPFPFALSHDGTRVVYRKPLSSNDHDLWSAPVDGSSPPVALAAPSGLRTVAEFQLAPDGGAVVYRADQDTQGKVELYRIPIDAGSPAVRLNQRLVALGDVNSFRLTPDGGRVVYLADAELDERVELYSVPSDASRPPVRLNAGLVSGGDVTHFAISPDGERVVYRADQVNNGQFDLFSVPVQGKRPPLRHLDGTVRRDLVRLTMLPAGRRVEPDFLVSADGAQVIYRANPAEATSVELFRVPIHGGAGPVQLSALLAAGGDVISFALSPDQSRVVYLADQRADQVFELFSVPLVGSGGGPVLALDTLPAFADVTSFRIDPDSQRVVYLADRDVDDVLELFAVPLDGSAPPRRVNPPLPAGGGIQAGFVLIPGDRVLYRADQESNDVFELFLGLLERKDRIRR